MKSPFTDFTGTGLDVSEENAGYHGLKETEGPFADRFSSYEDSYETNRVESILFDNQVGGKSPDLVILNQQYGVDLGWDKYYNQINDLLLTATGQSGKTLYGTAFLSAVAEWQRKNGLAFVAGPGIIDEQTWKVMRNFIFSFPVKSPSCDLAIAVSNFDIVQRQTVVPGLLTAVENKNAVAWNKAWLAKISIDPAHIRTDLERYIDLSYVRRAIDSYNKAHPTTMIDWGGGPIDAVFAEAVHQFQKKVFFDPHNIDGKAGAGTLHSLGIISFRQTSVFVNENARDQLKNLGIKVVINGVECNHTNWFNFTYNPSFLGLNFNHSVHYLLIKQLRIAEALLLSMPRFKGNDIVSMATRLGLSAKTEKHAGGRPHTAGGSSMHEYGLAIDIDHGGNPWIGEGWKKPPGPEAEEFLKTLVNAALPATLTVSSGKVFPYLDNIGTRLGANTNSAFWELKQRSNEFIAYLKKTPAQLTYWKNSKTFDYRDPLKGFLNLDPDLVFAIRQHAGLGWGAIDFGPSASGDIMHFDMRTMGVGREINTRKTPAGADPLRSHPLLRPVEVKEMEGEEYEATNYYFENDLTETEEEITISNEFDVASSLGKTCYLPVSLGKTLPAKTGVFIPACFNPGEKIDVVVFLHGHISAADAAGFKKKGIEHYWKNYSNIREHFRKSGRNAILLAPTLGPVSSKSFGSLGNKNGFDDYIASCFKELKDQNCLDHQGVPNRIILAAHSGGGNPMGKILNTTNVLGDNIEEVWGFDCLYWVENYRSWLKTLPRNTSATRNYDFYHYWAYLGKAHGSPEKNGALLQKDFSSRVQNVAPAKYTQHGAVIEFAWINEINARSWFDPLVPCAPAGDQEAYDLENYPGIETRQELENSEYSTYEVGEMDESGLQEAEELTEESGYYTGRKNEENDLEYQEEIIFPETEEPLAKYELLDEGIFEYDTKPKSASVRSIKLTKGQAPLYYVGIDVTNAVDTVAFGHLWNQKFGWRNLLWELDKDPKNNQRRVDKAHPKLPIRRLVRTQDGITYSDTCIMPQGIDGKGVDKLWSGTSASSNISDIDAACTFMQSFILNPSADKLTSSLNDSGTGVTADVVYISSHGLSTGDMFGEVAFGESVFALTKMVSLGAQFSGVGWLLLSNCSTLKPYTHEDWLKLMSGPVPLRGIVGFQDTCPLAPGSVNVFQSFIKRLAEGMNFINAWAEALKVRGLEDHWVVVCQEDAVNDKIADYNARVLKKITPGAKVLMYNKANPLGIAVVPVPDPFEVFWTKGGIRIKPANRGNTSNKLAVNDKVTITVRPPSPATTFASGTKISITLVYVRLNHPQPIDITKIFKVTGFSGISQPVTADRNPQNPPGPDTWEMVVSGSPKEVTLQLECKDLTGLHPNYIFWLGVDISSNSHEFVHNGSIAIS